MTEEHEIHEEHTRRADNDNGARRADDPAKRAVGAGK
jgi:hypothetical protein